MNPLYVVGGLSLLANLLIGGMYLDKRDDLAREIERCNTDKMTSIAAAEKLTRETIEAATAKQMADLAALAAKEVVARQIAEDARKLAESRPEKIRIVIQKSEDGCLLESVPLEILNELRN